ncbi:hypothetical protein K438DRAFT_1784234 [Mycena galopus ATCC 62051]|nr:hypothetical protein K438DRAFT_1784234 [Mycena galopus ATCC 62051]
MQSLHPSTSYASSSTFSSSLLPATASTSPQTTGLGVPPLSPDAFASISNDVYGATGSGSADAIRTGKPYAVIEREDGWHVVPEREWEKDAVGDGDGDADRSAIKDRVGSHSDGASDTKRGGRRRCGRDGDLAELWAAGGGQGKGAGAYSRRCDGDGCGCRAWWSRYELRHAAAFSLDARTPITAAVLLPSSPVVGVGGRNRLGRMTPHPNADQRPSWFSVGAGTNVEMLEHGDPGSVKLDRKTERQRDATAVGEAVSAPAAVEMLPTADAVASASVELENPARRDDEVHASSRVHLDLTHRACPYRVSARSGVIPRPTRVPPVAREARPASESEADATPNVAPPVLAEEGAVSALVEGTLRQPTPSRSRPKDRRARLLHAILRHRQQGVNSDNDASTHFGIGGDRGGNSRAPSIPKARLPASLDARGAFRDPTNLSGPNVNLIFATRSSFEMRKEGGFSGGENGGERETFRGESFRGLGAGAHSFWEGGAYETVDFLFGNLEISFFGQIDFDFFSCILGRPIDRRRAIRPGYGMHVPGSLPFYRYFFFVFLRSLPPHPNATLLRAAVISRPSNTHGGGRAESRSGGWVAFFLVIFVSVRKGRGCCCVGGGMWTCRWRVGCAPAAGAVSGSMIGGVVWIHPRGAGKDNPSLVATRWAQRAFVQ